MKPVDIIILCIIGAVLCFVLFRIKKKGSCGCGCGCKNCHAACQKHDDSSHNKKDS